MNQFFFTSKIISLFLIFLTLWGPLFGQSDYLPTIVPGAKWTIQKGQGMGSSGFSEVAISCDTLHANGEVYFPVQLLSDVNGANCGLGYVREDIQEQKLYFIPQEDEGKEEFLIVDYTLEKGDTFVNQAGLSLIVDTVRAITFFGKMTRLIDFGQSTSDGFIIGFGSIMAGPVFQCDGFTTIVDYEILDVNCSQTTVTDSERLDRSILIFPNPAKDQLTISRKGQSANASVLLQIKTITGEEVYRKALNYGDQIIDLSQLPNGILLFQMLSSNARIIRKVIRY